MKKLLIPLISLLLIYGLATLFAPAIIEKGKDPKKPVRVSHTGIRAVVNSPRNLSDEQIKKLAEKGRIIGIAFFDMVVGDDEIKGIVASMKKVKNLVGDKHVALGSDYDGSVTVPFDITGLPIIIEAKLWDGFTEDETRAIMGENVKRFLLDVL